MQSFKNVDTSYTTNISLSIDIASTLLLLLLTVPLLMYPKASLFFQSASSPMLHNAVFSFDSIQINLFEWTASLYYLDYTL